MTRDIENSHDAGRDRELTAIAATLPATVGSDDALTVLRDQALVLQQLLRVLQLAQFEAQWEYRFAAPKRASWVGEGLAWAEREFNQMGDEGWELVGFLEHGTACFKRRLAPS